jgi:predicted O-methyltransferase YrrM
MVKFKKLRKRHVPAVKLYRKIRYRKGYGVHSPFVYSFITKVIEEKASFYAFDEIDKLRQKIIATNKDSNQASVPDIRQKNYGALLFRIVNFFKCNTVLQIGSSPGILSLYLAMASPKNCRCYVLDKKIAVLEDIMVFSKEHQLHNLQFIAGDYKENLAGLHSFSPRLDMIFINRLPDFEKAEDLFLSCRPFLYKKTVLIINDIMKDKNMNQLWQKIKEESDVRVSIDLYALGIVFFDENLPKKHYKSYFDYGKKQSVHTNRRRGLYLTGRREKGSQIGPSHRSLRYH